MGPIWALDPNSPEYQGTVQAQNAQSAQLAMQQTQMAANSNYVNAQATAAINNSSDSPQGGVNIYLQGHEDGYQEGVEDINATTTINRQGNAIAFWQLAAGGLLCVVLGAWLLGRR